MLNVIFIVLFIFSSKYLIVFLPYRQGSDESPISYEADSDDEDDDIDEVIAECFHRNILKLYVGLVYET